MHLTSLAGQSDGPSSGSRDWQGCGEVHFIDTVYCDEEVDNGDDIELADEFFHDSWTASSYSESVIRRRRLMSNPHILKKKRRSYWPSGSVFSKKRVFQRSKTLGTSVSKAFTDALAKLEEMSHGSRNRQFHKLFSFIPTDENVIISYSCALVREIMLHGRMFVSQNWICFHSHIFTFETQVTIQMNSITSISKERTAFVIPNAIGIRTDNGKYVFGSLLSRQSTYIQLLTVWKSTIASTDLEEEVSCISQESSEMIESDTQSALIPLEGRHQDRWSKEYHVMRIVMVTVDVQQRKMSLEEDNISNHSSIHSQQASSSVTDTSPIFIHRILKHLVFAMSVFKSLERLLKIIKAMTPAQFFLLLTACLIICLTVSAVILTHRIARLQPQLEKKQPSLQYTQTFSEWSSLWWSQQATHSQQISQMWSTIADNLRTLAKVHKSLQVLQGSIQPLIDHQESSSENQVKT